MNLDNPLKRVYEENSVATNGYKRQESDKNSKHEIDVSSDDQMEDISEEPLRLQQFSDTQWQKTVEKVVRSVVSIHFSQVENFDTETASCSQATGFVVDSKLGIILTNRHVVGPGPFVGYAVFDNHEEVDVKPVYRDPVHDFGFLQFNPENIKYMKIDELELKPEMAKVGSEIRVIGNDSGEKLSILSGFISRLDRNAPDYGANSYNDFNTEYIQAAASASGGSSGSPVVNIDGYAVALQAGGSTESSTDFFLPIFRVLRALKCIQNREKITRGTIQVQWTLEPFDKCKRLGLTPETEKKMRDNFPAINSLLVSSVTLPKGPADNLIKEGDCLISINDQLISSFITVDDILDSNVGKEVELLIERGGKDLTVKCIVDDLHSITPNRYLTVCGATFNDLSYQLARIYAVPVEGVYVNNAPSYFALSTSSSSGWIVDAIDNINTPDLDSFIEAMKKIRDKTYVVLKCHHLADFHIPLFMTIFIDRHWCKSFKTATRNDETGLWDFTTIQKEPLPPAPLTPKSAKYVDLPLDQKELKKLNHSFVLCETHSPIPLDSFSGTSRKVYGVVLDAEKGYVIVSRDCVPHDMVDICLFFAESVYVPGEVVFLHPTKGYAVVKYDPSLVLSPVTTPKFSKKYLQRGEKVNFIGYNKSMRAVVDETNVSDIAVANLPSNAGAPKYRATNVEAVVIDSTNAASCQTGVLADNDGTIRALWMLFDGVEDNVYAMGIDVNDLLWELEFLKRGEDSANVKFIDAEFNPYSILTARINGVPEEWISKVEEKCVDKMQLLYAAKVSIGLDSKPTSDLKHGDILLSANGEVITRFRDIDSVIRNLGPNEEYIKLKVLRDKKIMDLDVKLTGTGDSMTDKLVYWAGAVLQAPHHGVRQVIKNLPSKVYCTAITPGSPSRIYGVDTTTFITHVNEIETPTLDDFTKAVENIEDNTYCKMRIVSFDNIPYAVTLKVNYHYFPTGEFRKNKDFEWELKEISNSCL